MCGFLGREICPLLAPFMGETRPRCQFVTDRSGNWNPRVGRWNSLYSPRSKPDQRRMELTNQKVLGSSTSSMSIPSASKLEPCRIWTELTYREGSRCCCHSGQGKRPSLSSPWNSDSQQIKSDYGFGNSLLTYLGPIVTGKFLETHSRHTEFGEE